MHHVHVVSSQGAYVAHWFEDPSFGSTRSFETRIIKGLKEGAPSHPSLSGHAGDLKNAVAFLVTPMERNEELRYRQKVNNIRAIIQDILPDVTFATCTSYVPLRESDLDEKEYKDQLKGTCLVHYQPASGQGESSYKVSIENKVVELKWT
jgi:hypothetical protein